MKQRSIKETNGHLQGDGYEKALKKNVESSSAIEGIRLDDIKKALEDDAARGGTLKVNIA